MTIKHNSAEKKSDNIPQNELINVQRSTKPDVAGDIFKIHLNEPVHDLSNEFCKYYYASNVENDSEFLAIVYENTFVHPVSTIATLCEKKFPYLNKIHAYSIVELSNTSSEHLVVIIDSYDPQSNLARYLEQNTKISLEMLEELVSKITELLESLHESKIYYANICPQNIIMQDDKLLFVKENINAMPLYFQPNAYLAPELINCHPAAREHCSIKVDIYALGMTIYASYTGKHPWEDLKTDKDYNDLRLENTTYKYLLNRAKLSERLRAFFKFTLHDDILVRWNPTTLIDWCNGKHPSPSKHDSITVKNNQIGFNDNNYSNLQSLSHAFFHDWEKALRFIKDDKLYKWASREQINNDVLDGIKEVIDLKATNLVVANNINAHAKLTRLLSFIDPGGSIRQMNFAISPTAIPQFMQYLFSRMKKIEYEKLVKIIKDELWQHYKSQYSIGHLEDKGQYLLRTAISNMIVGSATRGMERFIYAMNPNLRCMSKLLDKYYVTNLHELLTCLDKYANSHPKKFILDRHIIAFMSAKLDLQDDIRPTIFTNFPKIAEHPVIVTLSVMNILQQQEPGIKIPNICKAIIHELKELLEDNLHNIKFKEEIIDKVEVAGEKGDLSEIIKVLSNQQQFINDYNGYYDACRRLKVIDDQIFHLNNSDSMFNTSLLLGQKVSVLASYILCLIVTVTVML